MKEKSISDIKRTLKNYGKPIGLRLTFTIAQNENGIIKKTVHRVQMYGTINGKVSVPVAHAHNERWLDTWRGLNSTIRETLKREIEIIERERFVGKP